MHLCIFVITDVERSKVNTIYDYIITTVFGKLFFKQNLKKKQINYTKLKKCKNDLKN